MTDCSLGWPKVGGRSCARLAARRRAPPRAAAGCRAVSLGTRPARAGGPTRGERLGGATSRRRRRAGARRRPRRSGRPGGGAGWRRAGAGRAGRWGGRAGQPGHAVTNVHRVRGGLGPRNPSLRHRLVAKRRSRLHMEGATACALYRPDPFGESPTEWSGGPCLGRQLLSPCESFLTSSGQGGNSGRLIGGAPQSVGQRMLGGQKYAGLTQSLGRAVRGCYVRPSCRSIVARSRPAPRPTPPPAAGTQRRRRTWRRRRRDAPAARTGGRSSSRHPSSSAVTMAG